MCFFHQKRILHVQGQLFNIIMAITSHLIEPSKKMTKTHTKTKKMIQLAAFLKLVLKYPKGLNNIFLEDSKDMKANPST